MNNAPFHVGQNVVALKTLSGLEPKNRMVKGDTYTVYDCWKCSCGVWMVQLVELHIPCIDPVFCHNRNVSPYGGAKSSLFAPITPRSVSIPESLKEQAEEMISVKETIKEPKKELYNQR